MIGACMVYIDSWVYEGYFIYIACTLGDLWMSSVNDSDKPPGKMDQSI